MLTSRHVVDNLAVCFRLAAGGIKIAFSWVLDSGGFLVSHRQCSDGPGNLCPILGLFLFLVVLVESVVQHRPLTLVLMRAKEGNVLFLNRVSIVPL